VDGTKLRWGKGGGVFSATESPFIIRPYRICGGSNFERGAAKKDLNHELREVKGGGEKGRAKRDRSI